jgi:HEAT repeat protein
MLAIAAALSVAYVETNRAAIVEVLAKSYEDPRIPVRAAAVGGLGRIRDRVELVLPTLLRALGDRHWEVRRASAQVLGWYRAAAAAAIPALQATLEDDIVYVRQEAEYALRKIMSAPATAEVDGERR